MPALSELRHSFLLILLTLVPCSVTAEKLISVEEIVARHVEARGGAEAIMAIESLVFSGGYYVEGEYRSNGEAVMMLKRPYYKLVGHPDNPGAFMEGNDGAAWEWFADPGIVIRTVGAASAASRHGADIEGPLVNYQAKGYVVTLEGSEQTPRGPAYVLLVSRPDGYQQQLLIDHQSFLIVAQRHAAPVHAFGKAVKSQTAVEDYRPVAGVLFAHRFVEQTMASGEPMSSMQWSSIKANQSLPDAWFSPPEYQRTPIQSWMERLFLQRDDTDAMRWLYQRFRMTHPDLNTASASEFIGFQILKMGNVDSAIKLLEWNHADHPASANAAYELGRAYDTAGYPAAARRLFQQALALDPDHARSQNALE